MSTPADEERETSISAMYLQGNQISVYTRERETVGDILGIGRLLSVRVPEWFRVELPGRAMRQCLVLGQWSNVSFAHISSIGLGYQIMGNLCKFVVAEKSTVNLWSPDGPEVVTPVVPEVVVVVGWRWKGVVVFSKW